RPFGPLRAGERPKSSFGRPGDERPLRMSTMALRALAAAMFVIAVAACTSRHAAAVRSPSPPPGTIEPAVTLPPYEAGAPLCSSSDVRFRNTGYSSGITQDHGNLVIVTNVSDHSCRLMGAPTAVAKTSDGRVARLPTEPPGDYGPSVREGRVSLPPGSKA